MQMDDSARGWLFKTARREFWRVAGFYEFDDLLQEGYMCWWRCKRNYPLSRPHQIMGYFKIAFHNELNRMSAKRAKAKWLEYSDQVPDVMDYSAAVVELLAMAPQTVKQARGKLAADERMQRPYRRRRDGTRERTDERIARILDVPEDSLEIALIRAGDLSG